jgi:hypothetical protein
MLLGKWEDPDFEKQAIGLIKWGKARLENLLISPCLKRRIRKRAIRDYLRGYHQNPPHPFNIAPTNVHFKLSLKGNDY